jgi:hypothetical protein
VHTHGKRINLGTTKQRRLDPKIKSAYVHKKAPDTPYAFWLRGLRAVWNGKET